MATKKETAEVAAGANGTPAANIDDFSRFTWNIRGWQESLTIRCDSEEELKQLRDRWSPVINPPRRKIPYMHSGDEYEGDIIKHTNAEASGEPYAVPEMTISGMESIIGIGDSEWDEGSGKYSNIEIIGNVWENSELKN